MDFSLAVTEDGCVYSCGWGADGQTGLEHCGSVSKFTRVRGDIDGERIAKLSSRSDFVLALNGMYRTYLYFVYSLIGRDY